MERVVKKIPESRIVSPQESPEVQQAHGANRARNERLAGGRNMIVFLFFFFLDLISIKDEELGCVGNGPGSIWSTNNLTSTPPGMNLICHHTLLRARNGNRKRSRKSRNRSKREDRRKTRSQILFGPQIVYSLVESHLLMRMKIALFCFALPVKKCSGAYLDESFKRSYNIYQMLNAIEHGSQICTQLWRGHSNYRPLGPAGAGYRIA